MNPNEVFVIQFHVTRLMESIMPSELKGAYVTCYVGAQSYEDATKIALHQLAEDGLHPEEIIQPIEQMHPSSWTEHIAERWSDFVEQFPDQGEFEEAVRSGEVIYGPFASYE